MSYFVSDSSAEYGMLHKYITVQHIAYSGPHLKATIYKKGHIGNEKFVVPKNGKS